jgi:hypothetical protein
MERTAFLLARRLCPTLKELGHIESRCCNIFAEVINYTPITYRLLSKYGAFGDPPFLFR